MSKKSQSQKRRERNKFKREKRNRETDRAEARDTGDEGEAAGPSAGEARDREYARDLMTTALRIDGAEGREAMAREALSVFPDCSDALVVLAQLPGTGPAAAVSLCEQAVAAAARQLDGDSAEDLDVDEDPEAEPYLRARLALARALAAAGNEPAAREHLQWLVRVDPDDRVGARSLLDYFKP